MSPNGIIRRFLEAFGKALILNEDSLDFGNRDWGQWLTWGEERGVPDVVNSHYILNFGPILMRHTNITQVS